MRKEIQKKIGKIRAGSTTKVAALRKAQLKYKRSLNELPINAPIRRPIRPHDS